MKGVKDLFVRRVYRRYGIDIVLEIDYVKKTVSLTEKDGSAKQWVFAERTAEYLNGWRNILHAMEAAIAEAQAELAKLGDKEHKEFMELYVAIDKQMLKKQELKESAE